MSEAKRIVHRRAARRTPIQRITKNLRALKAASVIPPATLDYVAGKTPYVGIKDDEFLRDEISATQHALSELNALEPRILKVSIL